ncbi:Threonylcarbamoyl-AMP synthase [Polaribacter huanghezhanensis]|uniref:L-threonylcarbamoyladenylate synthase n=1 Tax=Polaribacter huanghezhanensis TaxID=1354726 RepID=UPI00264952AD|nr:L-threonylcarbamoyladenylate synthase [Polaribacter huanghezhanensis]WKD86996.1 Threonylcarbamoyl-AMP synthase [Polaribacter huanghezhanensis]
MNSEEIQHFAIALKEGKTLLYPTDTVWGIGCDATNSSAVSKIYKIKQRAESKSLIILVDSFQMLSDYVENIPEKAIEELEKATKPTTIIYNNPKGLAKNCIASGHTIAIRIVQNDFCKALLKEFRKPIVSTSANISREPTPKSFSEISATILDSVDYIVNLQQEIVATASSRILKIVDDKVEVIRD